jgi:hypothetical protein
MLVRRNASHNPRPSVRCEEIVKTTCASGELASHLRTGPIPFRGPLFRHRRSDALSHACCPAPLAPAAPASPPPSQRLAAKFRARSSDQSDCTPSYTGRIPVDNSANDIQAGSTGPRTDRSTHRRDLCSLCRLKFLCLHQLCESSGRGERRRPAQTCQGRRIRNQRAG